MSILVQNRVRYGVSVVWCLNLFAVGCRQNLLSTQNSVDQQTFSALQSPAGAQAGFVSAQANFINVIMAVPGLSNQGLAFYTSLMSDELADQIFYPIDNFQVDARNASAQDVNAQGFLVGIFNEEIIENLVQTRSQLLLLVGPLATYEQSNMTRSLAGTAYALAGYTELYMAEDYCPGVALDRALPGAGISLGTPLTTDSLLGTAIGHFDSALSNADQNDTVIYLANIGKGRAWLDRGQFDSATKAVAGVPLSFVYTLVGAAPNNHNTLQPNIWDWNFNFGAPYASWNVADRDGGVGINYVSAADNRLVLINAGETYDAAMINGLSDSIYYYPTKFGPIAHSTGIPIATGVEGPLIQAEADLAASGPAAWAADLNNLRNEASNTYLGLTGAMNPLPSDSTTDDTVSAATRVSVMFRERAFWLFGTGTRLGDMRREVKQYGTMIAASQQAAINKVYPNGPYMPLGQDSSVAASALEFGFPFTTYGPDVVLELPAPVQGGSPISINPQYHGCTEPTTKP